MEMNSKRLFDLILVIILLLLLFVFVTKCRNDDPVIPTVTPTNIPTSTEVVPTKTPKPTDVPTKTEVAATATLLPTDPVPTKTQKPTEIYIYVEVYTGWKFGLEFYEDGVLHFRDGPGTNFYPLWYYGENYEVIGGWLKEGTVLEFLYCVPSNEWMVVLYKSMEGFVKSEYVFPQMCLP